MKILMVTNTYIPHVGGVAKSVDSFTREYRKLGHRVMVVAPEFENQPEEEKDVVRVPAIQNFNGSDFSVSLPIPGYLHSAISDFKPDIVHSHHPFLLGDTALRLARSYETPLIFTHHTKYEDYTHYVPGDSQTMKSFVKNLAQGYANLCTHAIAPSESIKKMMKEEGVSVPIDVVPTGVDINRYAKGDGASFRNKYNITEDAMVIGHVGRLAPEKNLDFLADSVLRFLKSNRSAHFLVAGDGPSMKSIRNIFKKGHCADRLHMTGSLEGQELINAYHAMDFFAFASMTETQGMVITEAMAAGLPVAAVNASGVREVVKDKVNGCLISSENIDLFTGALEWLCKKIKNDPGELKEAALRTAARFSIRNTSLRALEIYEEVLKNEFENTETGGSIWEEARKRIKSEWELMGMIAGSATDALSKDNT